MRKLIWLIVVVALLWCGWWMLAMFGMERGIASWFEDQRNAGLRAEVGAVTQAGFPFALKNRLDGVVIGDPKTGSGVALPHIDVSAAAYWPGFMRISVSEAPIQLLNPDGDLTLEMKDGAADLRLRPGPALVLESMQADAASWKLSGAGGTVLSAQSAQMAMVQAQVPEAYQITLTSAALTPGGVIRTALQLPANWPLAFETFDAEMEVAFDRVWDRHAAAARPQPRAIKLEKAQAIWGALRFESTADLQIDASGVPNGTASLQAQNWREVLALAASSGAVAQGAMVQAETVLGMLGKMSGDPADLDITLTFEGGQMRMGFIPLGPAPRIVLE
jgi:hypothetical protein